MDTPATGPGPTAQDLDPLTFPLHGSRLIEASAGTGKTYTLALLYTRLVLGHGTVADGQGEPGSAFREALMPPNILVMTFTEAATKELRERIRARLVATADLFQQAPRQDGPAPQPESEAGPASMTRRPTEPRSEQAEVDPILALRDTYPPEQWPSQAQRLRRAAEWMDEAMISTIHAWCRRMLQEHAFATGGLFQRELITDQTELIAEVLRDYWRVHFYPLAPDDALLVRDVVPSPEALRKKLDHWLRRRDADFSYLGQPIHDIALDEALACERRRAERKRELASLEDAARASWRSHRQELEAALHQIRPHLNGSNHRSATPQAFDDLLGTIARWADGEDAPTHLRHFAQGHFVFKKSAPVQREPSHPAFQAIAVWRQALDVLKQDVLQDTNPPLAVSLLVHAAAWVQQALQRRLRQRAEMGFDELLSELDAALTPPATAASETCTLARALAGRIRSQFPVALIDEFQDTDPLQYRILDAIYDIQANDPASALVMIGDPKQAIYGFRGADIHAYLAARQATAGRHYHLGRNFRSTDAMVMACNRLFRHAESHPRGAFRFRSDPTAANPIPFVKVKAKGRRERFLINGRPAPAMTFWRLETESELVSSGEYRDRMAAIAASEIVRWLTEARARLTGFAHAPGSLSSPDEDEGAPLGVASTGTSPEAFRPLRPKDIAVLVRSGDEAAAMRQALAQRHINSVYLSARDSVFQTTEAQDLLHWLRACAAPEDERLVRAALATNTLAIPFEELARLFQDELRWEAQIERFTQYRRTWQGHGVLAMLHRLMHETRLPERLLGRDNGERIMTNLLHLAEWLQQSASELDGEQALIRQLCEHIGRSGEEFVVRLESDAELIQVVTIHKSKGLEYPLVLLPFICSWRAVDGHSSQVSYRGTHQPPSKTAPDEKGAHCGDTAQGSGTQAEHNDRVRPPSRYLELGGKDRFPVAWEAADDERISEDMRLLYVAVTRARHAVWMGIAPLKHGNGRKPQLERSAVGHVLNGGQPFESALTLWHALERVREADPDAGGAAERNHEASRETIHILEAPEASKEALLPEALIRFDQARTAAHTAFPPWWIASYSALRLGAAEARVGASVTSLDGAASDAETPAQETALEEQSSSLIGNQIMDPGEDASTEVTLLSSQIDSPHPSLHALPRGSRYGTFLHGLLEWAAMLQVRDQDGRVQHGYAAAARSAGVRRATLARRCTLRGLGAWIDPLDRWLEAFLNQPWTLPRPLGPDPFPPPPTLVFSDLSSAQYQVEMEFMIESRRVDTRALDQLVQRDCLPGHRRPELVSKRVNGMLKGFIDLVFEHQGRYYVLDWKSNWLGPDDEAYTLARMRAAILHHRYDLQYLLYLLALHRQLRARLPGYDYDRHIGGVIYWFLRGTGAVSQGLFADRPSRVLIESLDRLFAGESLRTRSGAA